MRNIYLNEVKNNKIYYFLLFCIILISTLLNYNANMMGGILPYYANFERIISSNFNKNVGFIDNIYTWPMWGYGYILLFFKYKIIIIFLQQLLTILTIISIKVFAKKYLLNQKIYHFFSLTLLFSFSWFFFHTSLWPYSISSNLLILSIVLFINSIKSNKILYLIYSSILWGIMLNFRSDYYYLTFALSFAFFFYKKLNRNTQFKFAFFWLSINFILLTPWALYTNSKTGHFLPISTNGGHVLFISLGQLPNNKWDITANDGDLTMHELVVNKFGKNESSLSYNSDLFLKKEFKKRILKFPLEYGKKVIYNFANYIIFPFYNGSIHEIILTRDQIDSFKNKIRIQYKNRAIIGILKLFFTKTGVAFLPSILLGIFNFAIIIFFYFHILTFIFFFKKYKCSILIFSLFIVLIIYQIVLNIFAYYLPIYNTNLYLLYIFILFYLIQIKSANNLIYKEKVSKI